MTSSRRVLLCVTEAGAAAYVAPLVRVLQSSPAATWRLFATDVAGAMLARAGLSCHEPLSPETSPAELRERLGDWLFDRALVSATGSPVEAAVYDAARATDARILGFIDAFTPCLPRFLHDGRLLLPDDILVIDEAMARDAAREGLPEDRLRIIGQPAWETRQPSPAASPRSVLFVGQPVRRWYADTLGYDEHSAWRLLVDCCHRYPALLERPAYAVHPGAAGGAVTSSPGDAAAVEHDAPAALDRYGTVVGMFSSLLVEALLAGRRVISAQPGCPATDMCVLSRRGLITRVGDPDSLARALAADPGGQSARTLAGAVRGSVSRLLAQLAEAA